MIERIKKTLAEEYEIRCLEEFLDALAKNDGVEIGIFCSPVNPDGGVLVNDEERHNVHTA